MLMMVTILRRERCPRCGGNVTLKADTYGRYWSCIQCGQTWEVEEEEQGETVRRGRLPFAFCAQRVALD
jgi:ribosomal protein S27AE